MRQSARALARPASQNAIRLLGADVDQLHIGLEVGPGGAVVDHISAVINQHAVVLLQVFDAGGIHPLNGVTGDERAFYGRLGDLPAFAPGACGGVLQEKTNRQMITVKSRTDSKRLR